MAEQVVLYQAADGTLFESEVEAHRHDVHNGIARYVDRYLDENVTHRTMSRKKFREAAIEIAMTIVMNEVPDD